MSPQYRYAVTNMLYIRVRSYIIGNESIETVGKSQSCMVSEFTIICEIRSYSTNLTLCLDDETVVLLGRNKQLIKSHRPSVVGSGE